MLGNHDLQLDIVEKQWCFNSYFSLVFCFVFVLFLFLFLFFMNNKNIIIIDSPDMSGGSPDYLRKWLNWMPGPL